VKIRAPGERRRREALRAAAVAGTYAWGCY